MRFWIETFFQNDDIGGKSWKREVEVGQSLAGDDLLKFWLYSYAQSLYFCLFSKVLQDLFRNHAEMIIHCSNWCNLLYLL